MRNNIRPSSVPSYCQLCLFRRTSTAVSKASAVPQSSTVKSCLKLNPVLSDRSKSSIKTNMPKLKVVVAVMYSVVMCFVWTLRRLSQAHSSPRAFCSYTCPTMGTWVSWTVETSVWNHRTNVELHERTRNVTHLKVVGNTSRDGWPPDLNLKKQQHFVSVCRTLEALFKTVSSRTLGGKPPTHSLPLGPTCTLETEVHVGYPCTLVSRAL